MSQTLAARILSSLKNVDMATTLFQLENNRAFNMKRYARLCTCGTRFPWVRIFSGLRWLGDLLQKS